jgi:hypothetical protein
MDFPKVGKVFRGFVVRTEITFLAGPRQWGDTRGSWLARVPKIIKRALGTEAETVSVRMVKSLWYGEISSGEHHAARDIKRAVEVIKARDEARALAEKYQSLIGGMRAAHPDTSNPYSEDIARLERIARILGGESRPR